MPVLLEGRLMTTQNRLAPAEAYCSVCRKWHPMAEYAWGTYKCKACMRAYNRAYYLKRKAALKFAKIRPIMSDHVGQPTGLNPRNP